MYISGIYNGTGSGFLELFDNVYGQFINETKGIEARENLNGKVRVGESNSIITDGAEIITSDYCSMEKGTAYDLVLEDYAGVVEMKKINTISTDSMITIEKWYNRFIELFCICVVILIATKFMLNDLLPDVVVAIGIIIFLSGVVGLYIDKVRWREKNDYSNM